jgi:hypothetical protein
MESTDDISTESENTTIYTKSFREFHNLGNKATDQTFDTLGLKREWISNKRIRKVRHYFLHIFKPNEKTHISSTMACSYLAKARGCVVVAIQMIKIHEELLLDVIKDVSFTGYITAEKVEPQ